MWARGIMAMRILFSTTWRPANKMHTGCDGQSGRGARGSGRSNRRPLLALFRLTSGPPSPPRGRTCLVSVARSVHLAGEELEADDGVDDHDEGHEQHDLGQGDHGQHDGVYDDLQACTWRHILVRSSCQNILL